MDESKPAFPSYQLGLHPASARKRAVIYALSRASKAVTASAFRCLSLCVLLLAAFGPTASRSPADAITFDTSKRLDDFEFATAGDGKPGDWSIIENDAGRVLAQIDADPTDNRFAFAIYRPFLGRDAYVSIRFMTVSGETDQSAGVFVRFTSVDDYYVARASALENNVGLYRVVAGKRQMIGCMEVNVSGQEWHTLGIAARDERLTIFFDGRSFSSRSTGGFRVHPAALAYGLKPTA
jgi:hypothetical protein